MHFMFENLEVYQRSLKLVEDFDQVIENLKGKVPYSRQDQLSRASLSIPLNIAEGNGRWHVGDRKQFFTIARGSVFECVPLIQIFRAKGLLDDGKYESLYSELQVLAKMLSALIKAQEKKQE